MAGLIAVVALAAAVAVVVLRPDEDRLTVISFNLCGNVCNAGDLAPARFAAELAERHDADVLLLQEACRNQTEEVARRLGWSVHHVTTYSAGPDGGNACPGQDYGIAVVSRTRAATRFAPALPNPSDDTATSEVRAMACVDVDDLVACTTHLVPPTFDADSSAAQLDAVAVVAERLASEHDAVVVGGDLNVRFASLDVPEGYVTRPGRGVDHVLATASAFGSPTLGRYGCECSDHDAVVARFPRR